MIEVNAKKRTTPSRARIRVVQVAVIMSLVVVGYFGVHSYLQAPASAGVRIVEATQGPVVVTAEGRATLVPKLRQQLVAKAGGRVLDVLVTSGQTVSAGEVLVVVESPETNEAYDEALSKKATVEFDHRALILRLTQEIQQAELDELKARNQAYLARKQFEAEQALSERGIVGRLGVEKSRIEAEQRDAEATFAKSRLELLRKSRDSQVVDSERLLTSAERSVMLAKRQVDALTFKAPTDGRIADLEASIGQVVNAGAHIVDVIGSELIAEIRVPEGSIVGVAAGQNVTLGRSSIKVAGKVSGVAAQATDGFVVVRASIENHDSSLRPSMVLDASIQIARVEQAILIERPRDAEPGKLGFVYRVDADGVARRQAVRFGMNSGGNIVVDSGLQKGDRVAMINDTAEEIRL